MRYARWYVPQWVLTIVVCAGCQKPTPEIEKSPAEAILEKTLMAYRTSDTYADAGELRVRCFKNGVAHELDRVPLAVSYRWPRFLRMDVFETMLVSDGQLVRASVGQIERQVLEYEAPHNFNASNFILDKTLAESLNGGRRIFAPPQVDLLLSDRPSFQKSPDGKPPRLLEEKETNKSLRTLV